MVRYQFQWSWVTLSDVAKYLMTWSIARPRCDSGASSLLVGVSEPRRVRAVLRVAVNVRLSNPEIDYDIARDTNVSRDVQQSSNSPTMTVVSQRSAHLHDVIILTDWKAWVYLSSWVYNACTHARSNSLTHQLY